MRCAARSRTASARRRCTSNSSRRPRRTSSAACRSTSRRWRSTARSRRRSARQPLKPEKSVNLSFGATANPLRGLTFTADYYHIKIKDRIVLTENLGAAGSGYAAVQNAAVNGDARRQRLPERRRCALLHQRPRHDDAGSRRGRGLPASGLASFGSWNLTAAYNYNKHEDRQADRTTLGPLAADPRPGAVRPHRGHSLHRRPAARQGRAQRRRRHRQVRHDRADDPLRQGGLAGRRGADHRPDQPHRLRAGRHLPQRQVDHRPRGAAARAATASSSRSARTMCSTSIPTARRSARGRRRSAAASIRRTRNILPYSIFSPFGFNGRFVYGRVSVNF